MMLCRLMVLGLLAVCACSSTTRGWGGLGQAERGHDEATYGVTSTNPIRIGGGPLGEYLFFERLRGEQGQQVTWRQVGWCCEFKHSPGLVENLELYEVTHDGMSEPTILYLDVYHTEPVFAPRGFIFSVDEQPEEAPEETPKKEPPQRSPEVIEL